MQPLLKNKRKSGTKSTSLHSPDAHRMGWRARARLCKQAGRHPGQRRGKAVCALQTHTQVRAAITEGAFMRSQNHKGSSWERC
ncbi:hypothetical protein PHYPO_G00001840 [Pangasianodon hypophthalmus]|uniref:Uncharacterized protein n=1 Tax=Pangasianodon hypophthalmus TaxID=310915 RepID=A0A5N5Q5S0_PANHP|nr:hypothetical protein PHYPO_G00001840 [Pangasianodon hypophthalmus]